VVLGWGRGRAEIDGELHGSPAHRATTVQPSAPASLRVQPHAPVSTLVASPVPPSRRGGT
jgi:hypothetical protein